MATEEDVDALAVPVDDDDVDALAVPVDEPPAPANLEADLAAQTRAHAESTRQAEMANPARQAAGIANSQLNGALFGIPSAVFPYVTGAAEKAHNVLLANDHQDYKTIVKRHLKDWQNNKEIPGAAAAEMSGGMATGGVVRGLGANALANTGQAMSDEIGREGGDLFSGKGAFNVGLQALATTVLPYALKAGISVSDLLRNGDFADYITKAANKAAARATGVRRLDLDKYVAPGGGSAAEDIGATLREKGVVRGAPSAETMYDRVKNALTGAGREMQPALDAADAATGGTGPEVRRAVGDRLATREGVETAAKNDALFETGKYDERTAAHADQTQDYISRVKEYIAERAGYLPEYKGIPRANRVTSNQTVEGVKELLEEAPSRVAGDAPPLYSVDPKDRVKEAAKMASEAAESKLGPIRDTTKGLGFDAHRFLDSADSELRPYLDDPANQHLIPEYETLVDAYRKKAAAGMSFNEAREMKTRLQETVKKFKDSKGGDYLRNRLQRFLNNSLGDQIGEVAGEDLTKQYTKAKADYHALAPAEEALGRTVNQLDAQTPRVGNWMDGVKQIATNVTDGRTASAYAALLDSMANRATNPGLMSKVATFPLSTLKGDQMHGVARTAGPELTEELLEYLRGK